MDLSCSLRQSLHRSKTAGNEVKMYMEFIPAYALSYAGGYGTGQGHK